MLNAVRVGDLRRDSDSTGNVGDVGSKCVVGSFGIKPDDVAVK